MNCIFCNHISPEQILCQTTSFKVVLDIDPIQTGHLLIISNKHVTSITQLPPEQLQELIELEVKLIQILETELPIDGVTMASNDKDLLDAGTHFHVHLIPRVKEDGFWEQIELSPLQFSLDTFLKIVKVEEISELDPTQPLRLV
ncbi:HIT family protein [Streptococcus cameli]